MKSKMTPAVAALTELQERIEDEPWPVGPMAEARRIAAEKTIERALRAVRAAEDKPTGWRKLKIAK